MKKNNILLKIIIFGIGLFVMAFGVALSVKANLGVSPISCIPYVFSFKSPLSLGTLTIFFNIFLMLIQIGILRRNYRLIQLLQLPMVFAFGLFIDFALRLISGLNLSNYFLQVLFCLISCILIGFGVFLEVKAKLTYLPGEGLAMAIVDTFKKEFGKVKIGVDSTLVFIGLISSFVFFHQLQGIREGTVVAAILVGFIAKFCTKRIHIIDSWIEPSLDNNPNLGLTESNEKNNLVITISREHGSGGHEIGKHLAEKLGISFYDKKLIDLTTKQTGFTSDYIKQNEQKLVNSLLAEFYEQNYAYVYEKQVPLDVLFLVQSKIIRDICAKESCVIVGRCANFILKDKPNCFNVFIHANKNYRKAKISDEYEIESEITDSELRKTDKERANYCLHYTGENWNNATNYNLTIDSSEYDLEEIVDLITISISKNKRKLSLIYGEY
ncbi:cytidylate kinase family protein [Ancylomarina sp. 16SWW S1-10-2]|uniref:cytidylate kinase family protein n=1 Tax=Ancylomarina sp. 16SWW S1-10-2 TaxID=2499681 RepID=UPI0012AD8CFC|nr:cytidylate kinase family protein [Ancylomarina sp. 16SWW S1-10-2]MRT92979.1 cytidylate kinase family protein [Ancylomarina sp. 16SWW S1-10-2]